jgi:hypothetical protein
VIFTLALASAAAASPATAIDAERAFIRDAQTKGQWAAFRQWAAEDATMFAPQPVNAQAFLKDLKDPPVSVYWWPGRSYVSCDGSFAINTGPWVRNGGKAVGYFTTIWKRQPDGAWKWIYDGGDELKVPRAEGGDIQPTRAVCGARLPPAPAAEIDPDVKTGFGESPDGTLRWNWSVGPDGRRSLRAWLLTERGAERVIDDQVGAPPPQ